MNIRLVSTAIANCLQLSIARTHGSFIECIKETAHAPDGFEPLATVVETNVKLQ